VAYVVLAPNLTVVALLSRWPRTIPVFLRHRMACVGCALARFESMAAAANAYGLPLDGS
jgi:hybrid cluster-associated redox disulfide protein